MTKKQMFMQAVVFCLAWCALPFLLACDSGCEIHEGVCACNQRPEQLTQAQEVQPSDEKPSRHPQPAYQRGGVVASSGQEEQASAYKRDKEIDDANAEGKQSAGIKN